MCHFSPRHPLPAASGDEAALPPQHTPGKPEINPRMPGLLNADAATVPPAAPVPPEPPSPPGEAPGATGALSGDQVTLPQGLPTDSGPSQSPDVTGDLGRFVVDGPIVAGPVGGLERAAKWARRNPVLAGTIATTVGVTAAAFVVVLLLWAAAERQRCIAEAGRDDAQAAEAVQYSRAEEARAAEDRERRAAEAARTQVSTLLYANQLGQVERELRDHRPEQRCASVTRGGAAGNGAISPGRPGRARCASSRPRASWPRRPSAATAGSWPAPLHPY